MACNWTGSVSGQLFEAYKHLRIEDVQLRRLGRGRYHGRRFCGAPLVPGNTRPVLDVHFAACRRPAGPSIRTIPPVGTPGLRRGAAGLAGGGLAAANVAVASTRWCAAANPWSRNYPPRRESTIEISFWPRLRRQSLFFARGLARRGRDGGEQGVEALDHRRVSENRLAK
jgi:hypothetical protein